MAKRTITYSAAKTFKNCPRNFYWRNVRQLVPVGRDDNKLFFGQVIHRGLEMIYHGKDGGGEISALINKAFPGRDGFKNKTMAAAMLDGYQARYRKEPFRILAIEGSFTVPIRNPKITGRLSRSFELSGKVDLVGLDSGGIFIIDHKTAAEITGDIIEKLPLDSQLNLYAVALSHLFKAHVNRAMYNIIRKARIKPKKNETDAEFETRMDDIYSNPENYHREMVILSDDDRKATMQDLWETTQHLLEAYRTDTWTRNTDRCFDYFRPCPYFALCRSNNDQNILDNFYEHRPANSELKPTPNAVF